MEILIIKEDVRTEGFQDFGFLNTSEEEDLINVDTPAPERLDHAHLRRRVSSSNDRNSDGREFDAEGKSLLQSGEFFQKNRVGTFRHRNILVAVFTRMKAGESFGFVDKFAALIEEHCVTVESNSNLPFRNLGWVFRGFFHNCCSTLAAVNDFLSVLNVRSEK